MEIQALIRMKHEKLRSRRVISRYGAGGPEVLQAAMRANETRRIFVRELNVIHKCSVSSMQAAVRGRDARVAVLQEREGVCRIQGRIRTRGSIHQVREQIDAS